MSIIVTCPDCGKRFNVKDEFAGKTGKCPACGGAFVVPAELSEPQVLGSPGSSQRPGQPLPLPGPYQGFGPQRPLPRRLPLWVALAVVLLAVFAGVFWLGRRASDAARTGSATGADTATTGAKKAVTPPDRTVVSPMARFESDNNVRKLVLGVLLYAGKHNGTYPDDIKGLMPYVQDEKCLVNPLRPDLEVGYVYIKPGATKASSTVVLHEKFETWPEEGVACGFLSGFAKRVTDENQFKAFLGGEVSNEEFKALLMGAGSQ